MLPPQALFTNARMSGPHKRRHSSSSSLDDTSCHLPKKLKLHYPPFPPRRFWDGLSEIPLTKNALRALNEENSQESPVVLRHRQHQHRLRPRPRPKTGIRRQSADKIVRNYSEAALARVKAFARHGGPDLTVIRGVCSNLYCFLNKILMPRSSLSLR